ncbi:MAG: calcium/sodium antiporter [Proteobacteria bacterium]|nr:calcium/sodium antiporter [Pseudomonadota bacterium]
MSLITMGMMLTGLVLLVIGAEALVRGASRIAVFLGISPLIVGLTVVAYGTSAPEMAVSVMSSLKGQADISLGNVVGSNIFNVLLILGVSALAAPLVVSRQLIRIDVPIMIGMSVFMFFLAWDGRVSQGEGFVLIAGAVVYTGLQIFLARRENHKTVQTNGTSSYAIKKGSRWRQWLMNLSYIGFGLVLLMAGSHFLVKSAVILAQWLGVSELIIGLTIVAAGTSLPELATSVMASFHGERDIAVGNVVGSNIFNILAVLGISAAFSDSGVAVADQALKFDIPVMIAAAVACLPIFFTGHRISRWEGVLFLSYYGIYTAYLILMTRGH